MRIPALLFLECIDAQVTIRSPIPESPLKVSSLPPIAIPSLDISAIPLVIRAALALSPHPRPSAIPAARAITFFKAALKLSEKYEVDMPIVSEVNEILFKGKKPEDALRNLMERDKRTENSSLDW